MIHSRSSSITRREAAVAHAFFRTRSIGCCGKGFSSRFLRRSDVHLAVAVTLSCSLYCQVPEGKGKVRFLQLCVVPECRDTFSSIGSFQYYALLKGSSILVLIGGGAEEECAY
jgi:hypothetical protein